ncbi:MAG TPA: hypothetical protein DCQ99_02365 [Nitrospinae bacterium]|nr:hypothetical protein [Nitrospinota bacterium]HBA26770.1 hypothetical protein [Nitrospinota bacterium]
MLKLNSGRQSVVSGQMPLLTSYSLLLVIFMLITHHSSLITEVFADEYHYNNIIIGDRASGMGGAYTAISDDASGCYYNPAGLIFASGRSLSASANVYNYFKKTYKDVLGGKGWERVSSNLLPNYFGIIQPLGQGIIGFSYAVPDSRLENQKQTFYNFPGIDPTTKLPLTITKYVINMNDTDYSYNFGPSYALKIRDNLSIGTTLYLHYRGRELISNHFLAVDDGRYEWRNVYDSLTEWGLKPMIGMIWNPLDKVSLGLTVSQNYVFNTDKRIQITYRGLDYGITNPAYEVWESTDGRKLPLTLTLGGAYFLSESLLFSADVSYYTDSNYTVTYKNTSTGATASGSIPQERTLNIAIGTEYYLNERVAMRGGFFTSMANTPKLFSGKTDQPEHIDMYGITFSISQFTRSSSLSLGGSYSLGTGEAQPYTGSTAIKGVEMQNLTAFISAAFTY